jgi:putative PEP-CTERM system histidine kinase
LTALEILFWASGGLIAALALWALSTARGRYDQLGAGISLLNWSAVLLAVALYLNHSYRLFHWGEISLGIAAAYLPFSWLLFTMYWGRDTSEKSQLDRRRLTLFAAFTLATAFAIADIAEPVLTFFPGSLGSAYFTLGGGTLLLTLFYLWAFLTGLFNVENCYRTALGSQKRRLAAGLYLSVLVTGLIFFAATLEFLWNRIPLWVFVISAVCAPVVALLLLIHLRRHDPRTIGVVVTRRSAYSSIVIINGGIFFLVVGLLAQTFRALGRSDQVLLPALSILLVVLLFISIYMMNRLQGRVRATQPSSYREAGKFEYREFIDEISESTACDEILERLNVLLHSNYGVQSGVLIEHTETTHYLVSRLSGGQRPLDKQRVHEVVEWLHRFGRPIIWEDLVERTPEFDSSHRCLVDTLEFQPWMLLPVIGRKDLVGVLVISVPASADHDPAELGQLLESISGPIALAIRNTRVTEQLLRAKELESFHKVSSFVLHDLKNSVGMLDLLLANARTNLDDPEFRQSMLETIGDAVRRQRRIIARLTDSPSNDVNLDTVDINDIVRQAVRKTQVRKIERITLTENYDHLPAVSADSQKLASVFENLIVNAIEAMPVRGTLEVTTFEDAEDSDLRRACVSVADTGCGMSEDFMRTRLFQPFMSTKKRGLGIGMYQSREAIRQMGGDIKVESEQGKGTRFTVRLPIH